MPIQDQGEVTILLEEIAAANNNNDAKQALHAKRALFRHVYDELKKMAYGRMKRELPATRWGQRGLSTKSTFGSLMTNAYSVRTANTSSRQPPGQCVAF
jgi:hypothetical protein